MAQQEATRAAVWARVSTADQHPENQKLAEWAQRRDVQVVREFTVLDSAWKSTNGKGKQFDSARAELLEGARRGEYQLVVIWSLDRWSRRGIRDSLATLERLWELGCDVWSQQEPFVEVPSEIRPLMVSVFAWMAEQESKRRSERTKAGLQRRKEVDGKPVGRQPGAADKKPRRRSGYVGAWEGPEGDARRAALAERNRQRARKPEDVG